MSEPLSELKKNLYHIMFDSVADLVDTAKEVYKKDATMLDIAEPSRASFIGRKFKNAHEAYSAIEKPWDEGLRTFQQVKNQIADERIASPKSLKRHACWSEDSGSEINVDRLREGSPFFRTTKRDHRPGPVSITLIVDVGANAAKTQDQIMYRGVASTILTELLEDAGYRVELIGVSASSCNYTNGKDSLITAILKYGSDPLDVSTLINITSGWALRTAWWTTEWFPPDIQVTWSRGGHAHLENHIPLITPDEQVIICENIWNHSQAVSWIRQEIEKLK
jgi:hypothetical protein